jgi:PAS domain S-box-containing protein
MNDLKSYISEGAFYKAVVEDGSDIIIILDFSGNIMYHNKSVEEILGHPFNSLNNQNFFDYILPETINSLKTAFEACKKEAYTEKVEFQFRCKSGEYKFLEFNAINLLNKDNIEGFILDCRDISQRKKYAEELMQAQKAREQFLAKISHEIRTPINGIIGMTNLLSNSTIEKDRESYINAIKYSAENLKVIINDILDLSLIESGKLKFEKVGFNIIELIPSIISTFSFQAREKNNELVYTINSKLDKVLLGDPVRLNQVLMNLISNAVKFTENGRIEIRADLLKEENEVCLVEFHVKDNGIGVKPDKINLIFESFSQADESITRKYGGTGLGLTISKQLIESQNGNIKVISKENEGSEFIFTIPYPIGKSEDLVEYNSKDIFKSSALSFKNMSVLLVEDNDINRLYAGTILKRWDCKVEMAENGLIAVNKMHDENKYDIILMDIMMPVMDGFEASKEIRKIDKKIPIVALSATANKTDHEKSREAGMDEFITKPFNPDELFLVLNKIDKPYKAEQHLNGIENKKLIDLTYLSKMTGSNAEFLNEMKNTFLSSLPPEIDELEKQIESFNLNNISKIVHKLKPSFELMGLKQLREFSSLIEEYVHLGTEKDEVIKLAIQIVRISRLAFQELKDESVI